MVVPAKPFLPVKQIFQFKLDDNVFPWNNITFYKSGCDAPIAALIAHEVPQKSRIAIPALICRSVPDSLERFGFTPVFFDLSNSFEIPLTVILKWREQRKIDAVLLVDYFGFFPVDQVSIINVLQKKGCLVLKDRCHSALSNPNCETADAVIYSIRKSLVVSDGGALQLRNKVSTSKAER